MSRDYGLNKLVCPIGGKKTKKPPFKKNDMPYTLDFHFALY